MGAGLAKQKGGGPLAELRHGFVVEYADSSIDYASGSSLAVVKRGEHKTLVLGFQAAAGVSHEGSCTQHLRFTLSKDGGDTWSAGKCVMWGSLPLWGPSLHFDTGSNRLFMFYCESRKSLSPGGDVKYITTSDLGETWTAPVTIYTHEAEGEVPKVCGAKLLVSTDGTWYLPVHQEPRESWHTFTGKAFHPLSEAPEELLLAAPTTAAPQSMTTAACVLVSRDQGASWSVGGEIEDPKTWLVNPTLEQGSKGQLIMLFRTAAGKVYIASSSDQGKCWSRPAANLLPNPNSPFATVTIDGQVLCVFNNSQTTRAPLALALSVNDCKTWEPLCMIEEDASGNFTCPSIVEWADDTVKVAYTSWGQGLKLATVKLATVES